MQISPHYTKGHTGATRTHVNAGLDICQSMEPQFYKVLIETLQLDKKTLPHQYDQQVGHG